MRSGYSEEQSACALRHPKLGDPGDALVRDAPSP
jgi:hypothetical protein